MAVFWTHKRTFLSEDGLDVRIFLTGPNNPDAWPGTWAKAQNVKFWNPGPGFVIGGREVTILEKYKDCD